MYKYYTILLLVLTHSIAVSSTCYHGTCVKDYAPTTCLAAPRAPAGKVRRTDRLVQSRGEARDLVTEIPKIDSRGNPVCWYPEGVLSRLLVQGVRSMGFVLPAGRYTLDWISGFTPDVDLFFELYRTGPDGTRIFVNYLFIDTTTFFSDGVTELSIILRQIGIASTPETAAEVWINSAS